VPSRCVKEIVLNVSIGERWERFVEEALRTGRYGSASEVVREGLRLVEERETKLQALRETLRASVDVAGEATDESIDAALDERAVLLREKGVAD
jgi:antitoxin ParD1/3/4